MVVKESLKAGLVTGLAAALLMFLIFFLWGLFQVVWPVAFVPLFATGVYAVHRCGLALRGAGGAALAGGLAGLAAGAVSLVAVTLASILSAAIPGSAYPIWNLVPVLRDSPFFHPRELLFYEIPGVLPFPWPIPTRLNPEGVRVSLIPWGMTLFPVVGAVLSGLQSWLYYLLVRQAGLGARAVGGVAQMRASFQGKLLAGFLILIVLIFAVGWLGFAQTEAMHRQVHQVQAMRHWQDHLFQLQGGLAALELAYGRLPQAREEGVLQEVTTQARKIAEGLAHLKAVPPPIHSARETGYTGPGLRAEAQKRLPVVREADSRFSDLNKALARVVDLSRAGDTAEAQALLATLGPLQRAMEAPLAEMAQELHENVGAWIIDTDQQSHGEQMATMLLVLAATGLAFPLAFVFAQVVVRPVQEVSIGLERIGEGDFSTQVQVENRDELGELAGRVNQMSGELDRLYGELRVLNENLQQKVQEQLQEIEHANLLKRYLSPQVADSIIAGQSDVQLATTRKNLTVCFSDIRGFTALSERMEPEDLIDLLNAYFSTMTDIVFQHGGTLDKYLGDGIMVFFGDPIPYNDHAERAVSMALDMRARLVEFQKRWFVDRQETLNIGIGISTGYVTVGNIGSTARLEYTVIGNNVNLASRLADMATPGQILIAERTLVPVREQVQAREVGEVTVEGSARPVRIYEVLGLNTPGA